MRYSKLTATLAVVMMMVVLAAPVVTAEAGKGIDLTASVLEPKPEIGIEVNETALNFGELLPGQTSEPNDLKVTNIGLKTIDVTATVSDNGDEPLFVPGLLIDNDSHANYLATLAEDEFNDTQIALHVPDDYASRGEVGGRAIFWATEHTEPAETSDWVKFQHDYYNSGLTSDAAPRLIDGSPEFSVFTSHQTFYGIDTTPVVSGDTIYTISYGGKVFAFDKVTGATKWQYTLGGGFILCTPTVANGKVFVGDNGGTIAALDAATGAELWKKGIGGGQINTPVIYEDGFLYFGSWGGSYYCYDEQGNQIWSFADAGGFYWAGAAIVGDYIAFGSDSDHLYCLNKASGTLIDTVDCDALYGISLSNIRSSLCYVPSTERFYFTSHAGYCYYIGFDPQSGSFREEDSAKGYIGYSTSTPVVYNGRVYVGTGQFDPSGGLSCLDENTLAVIWNYVAGGGVQASPVVSTHYDNGDGAVYIYFTTNVKQGGLHCLKDVAGSSQPTEQFTYVPPANMQDYTLQGVAISDGMVYYGNDAGYLFAFTDYVIPPAKADFSADIVSGPAPLVVHFTDQSTNSPTSWQWDFDNDGTIDSTEQNPSWTYQSVGTYTVRLIASNATGSLVEVKTDLIDVVEPTFPAGLLSSTYLGGSKDDMKDGQGGIAVAADGSIYVTGFTDSPNFPVTAGAFQTSHGGGYDAFIAKYSSDMSTLLACTYLGGSGNDQGASIAIGDDGSVYVTGITQLQGLATPGAYQQTVVGGWDAYIAKFDPALSTLEAFTYLGGSNSDSGRDLVIDGDGNIYVTGITGSNGLATSGAYHTTIGGTLDAFVAKLDPTLNTLLAFTYFGGSSDDNGIAIAIGSEGNVFIVGEANSPGLATAGAYDGTKGIQYDVFIAKFNPALSTLLACTYFGGNPQDDGCDIAMGSDGNVYVTGYTTSTGLATSGAYDTTVNGTDAFVAKFDPALSSLLACTYLGGSGVDRGYALAVDGDKIYVSGTGSASDDGPDAYLGCLDSSLSSLLSSSYLGGTGTIEEASSIALASDGTIIVGGQTNSANMPMKNSVDSTYNGGRDYFIARWSFGGQPHVSPTADFSADRTNGAAPLTVQFTDLSTDSPTSWLWNFGDDSTSDEQSPSHEYAAPGTYTVTLTATNQYGSDDEVKTAYIVVTAGDGAYGLFHGDQQLSGYIEGLAPGANDTLWISEILDAQPSSSVVVAEGKVFVYCFNYTTGTGYIAALDLSSGELVWKEQCVISNSYGSWATPAYHDGLVFTSGDVARHASDGSPAWADGRVLPDNTDGGPMVADGKVFCGNWDGHQYFAFNEYTGEQLWVFNVSGDAQGTPAYHDGKLFLTSWPYQSTPSAGYLYCLDADSGEQIWSVGSGSSAQSFCGSPCVSDGYVYVTSYNFYGKGALFCFYESNGTLVWQKTIQRTDSTPAVHDGKVYVTGGCFGFSPHQTYCFDASTGTLIWSTTTDQDIGGWTTSVVIADGKVFVGREGSWGDGMRFGYVKLFALDANTGTEMWSYDGCGATVAIYDGNVYSVGIDGRVYAFGSP